MSVPALGSGQAVRQLTLDQPIGGSNPPSPADRLVVELAVSVPDHVRPTILGASAVLCGLIWAAHGWVTSMSPAYYSATSTLDYVAVALHTAGLVTVALCLWQVRVIPGALVMVGGAAATLGLGAAGVANFAEDWIHLEAFGWLYVAAYVGGTLALIPLAAGLARSARTRWLAMATVATFVGLLLVSQWYGGALLSAAWLATGAARMTGRSARQELAP